MGISVVAESQQKRLKADGWRRERNWDQIILHLAGRSLKQISAARRVGRPPFRGARWRQMRTTPSLNIAAPSPPFRRCSVNGYPARLDRGSPFIDFLGNEFGKILRASTRGRNDAFTDGFETLAYQL